MFTAKRLHSSMSPCPTECELTLDLCCSLPLSVLTMVLTSWDPSADDVIRMRPNVNIHCQFVVLFTAPLVFLTKITLRCHLAPFISMLSIKGFRIITVSNSLLSLFFWSPSLLWFVFYLPVFHVLQYIKWTQTGVDCQNIHPQMSDNPLKNRFSQLEALFMLGWWQTLSQLNC